MSTTEGGQVAGAGVPMVALAARGRRPRPRPGELERVALVGPLLGCEGVVAVVAPAGFGKTTTVRQWADAEDRPVAWLTIVPADDDPTVLARALDAVLRECARPAAVPPPSEAPGGGVAPILDALERADAFVLVLDDVHLLRTEAAADLLGAVIDALPAGCAIVLVGRHLPPDLHGPRRLLDHAGRLIGPDDLRLSDADARALVGGRRPDLSTESVDAIVLGADGWAALVGLALLAVPEGADPRRTLTALSPTAGQLVGDYLRAELLQALDPEALDLLVRTSVLDRVTGELCDAVLEREGSAAILEALAESGDLFVTAYDGGSTWYSYHQVLRDLLLATLRSAHPGAEAKLRLRAAAWLDRHGDPDAAIDQAAAAEASEVLAELVYRNLVPAVFDGRVGSVARWLGGIDEGAIVRSPALALAVGWREAVSGSRDEVRRWLGVVDGFDPQTQLPDGLTVAAGAAALRVVMSADGARRSLAAAELLESLGRTPWWPVARVSVAIARYILDDLPDPVDAMRQAVEDTSGNAAAHVVSLAYAIVTLVHARRPGEARSRAERLRQELSGAGMDHYPIVAVAHGALALEAAGRGDVDEVADRERLGVESILASPGSAVRASVTRLVLGDAWLRVGRPDRAAVHLDVLPPLLAEEPDAVRLHRWASALGDQVASARRLGAGLVVSFTAAERRVLAELPSHRSLEEIGARLFISRNTVKSHTIAIYRKLGVASRSEAVEAAAILGLVPGAGLDDR